MRVEPKTEEQLQKQRNDELHILPDGTYDFEVIEATEGNSKKGNPMITVRLSVWDNTGKPVHIYDYLMQSSAMMAFKLRHAADACGLMDRYEAGDISADDFLHKTGKALVGFQKGKDGFFDKNVIVDYVKRDLSSVPIMRPRNVAEELSDEIPF